MNIDSKTVLEALGPVLGGDEIQTLVTEQVAAISQQSPELGAHNAIRTAIQQLLSQNRISKDLSERLLLAIDIAEITDNNGAVIKAANDDLRVHTIGDFAVRFDTLVIEKILAAESQNSAEPDPAKGANAEATTIRSAVFNAVPAPTIQGMILKEQIHLGSQDPQVKADVISMLSKLDTGALGTVPVSSVAAISPEAFAAVAPERRDAVKTELKQLSRAASIAPTTKALEGLIRNKLTSSLAVSSIPKERFVSSFVSDDISASVASELHANAVNNVIRNENALVGLLQLVQGTGLQVIDGKESPAFRKLKVQELAAAQSYDLNFEALFGSLDKCSCDDCATVYSPASYFVDLLQYLAKTYIGGPDSKQDIQSPFLTTTAGHQPALTGTVLEKLFKRRPDLGNLQLTCQNTNAILPYIDLANEVMESFIVHLDASAGTTSGDAHSQQNDIDVYNVGSEDPEELLSQPQNTNFHAYKVLASASYPLSLPYHQPIDAQRAFLDFLKVPRLDLLDAFRQRPPILDHQLYGSVDEVQRNTLQDSLLLLQDSIWNRQIDAECLHLVQEDYLILTGEVFFPKDYFAITKKLSLTADEYQSEVGLLQPWSYWGYATAESLSAVDEACKTGLQFVKQQLLPRGGLSYEDLVSMVETCFINPSQPSGRDKMIFNELRFSYKFLLTLVDNQASDSDQRLGKLAEFLVETTNVIGMADFLRDEATGSSTSEAGRKESQKAFDDDEIRKWVFDNFERLGKVIVLDSGEGPRLSIDGQLVAIPPDDKPVVIIGTLATDGSIKDAKGITVGNVTLAGKIMMGGAISGITGKDLYKNSSVEVKSPSGTTVGVAQDDGTLWVCENGLISHPVGWTLAPGLGGSSSIDNVRLTHLDGTALAMEEWSRMNKFIRLRKALGWSVLDTDTALSCLVSRPTTHPSPDSDPNSASITFDDFTHDESLAVGHNDDAATGSASSPDIDVDTIHQLAAIKKLIPLTGLPLDQLLVLWASIPTKGPKSLYARLFLGSNIQNTDEVFGPDKNGDYFTGQQSKISDHLLVVLAAYHMKASDIGFLLGAETPSMATALRIPIPDILNIENLSSVYRYCVLASILGVQVSDMGQILDSGLPDPFQSPSNCLDFLQTWNGLIDIGFTWPQVRYSADNNPFTLDSLAPDTATVLQTAKVLHDGILALKEEHALPDPAEEITSTMVKTKLALVFDDKVCTEITQLLDGETVYLTRAPPVDDPREFNIALAAASASRASYIPGENGESSQFRVKGILTKGCLADVTGLLDPALQAPEVPATGGVILRGDKDKAAAKAADLYEQWQKTVERYCSQTRNVFFDSIAGIFPPDVAQQEQKLDTATVLAPDVSEDMASQDPAVAVQGTTSAQKRRYFLQYFLPFLQNKLARVLIEDTMIPSAGFQDHLVARTLLDGIVIDKKSQKTTMDVLLDNLKQPDEDQSGTWTGYLVTSTSDSYTFSVLADEDHPRSLTIDETPYPFTNQQEDPQRLWSTIAPVKLTSGKLYNITLDGIQASKLQWKPASGLRVVVPSASLLPKRAEGQLKDVFTSLQKLAIVVNTLGLTADEVLYINNHPADFEQLDFMHLSVAHLKRLGNFVKLRRSIATKTSISLLELFTWAGNYSESDNRSVGDNRAALVGKIAAATAWKPKHISQILDQLWFEDGAQETSNGFTNEVNLVKFARLIAISDKLGVGIPRLFSWARPLGTAPEDFFRLHDIAEDIQKVARLRFSSATWPDAVKPVNDALRENQRNALISYLLVQDEIRALDIHDADGLFEYFLIDTQMMPLVQTSRIKQAISTVQVYVQRCMLGLEAPYGVSGSSLDRQRWQWLQKYRLWEANRKVFLYPENWIDPSLRDNKSDFFKALESELLQKDLSPEVVSTALRTYLFSVSEVSNLAVAGLCVDYTDPSNPVHVFARTRTAPYSFYSNKYASGKWLDWKKMSIEVPYYAADTTGTNDDTTSGPSGVYFSPIAFNGRVVVFIPQIIKKITPPAVQGSFTDIGKDSTATVARNAWEIKLSWTEYRNGAWTARKLCPDGVVDEGVSVDAYSFLPIAVVADRRFPSGETPLFIKTLAVRARGNRVPEDYVAIGEWHFKNGELSFATNNVSIGMPLHVNLSEGSFQYFPAPGGRDLHSLQGFQIGSQFADPIMPSTGLSNSDTVPFSTEPKAGQRAWGSTITLASAAEPLYHPQINELMSSSMRNDDSALFVSLSQGADLGTSFGGSTADQRTWTFNEQSRPFSLYNWELGLHAPMAIADRLLKAQQFDQALDVCHHVFDPLAKGMDSDMTRFWVFAPFKTVKSQTLEALFETFKPGVERDDVTAWRDNPFAPHVIARQRPVAYMKWMVMKYIEILIEYGDFYFRQNTLETIPNAIQMYVFASHLYGPRGQKITRQGKTKTYTYNSLIKKWDAFSNAMVQMEEAFPFSNQTPLPIGKLPDDPDVQMANIFGSAGTLLFSIPDNPNLRALGERIDDRLFKIRHSQDINGILQKLPLFEPPIEPALLVQAAAQGLSLNSVLTDLNTPMPNYRIQYLLQKALELVNEVRSFGQALLSAKEKQDSESYAMLRASHEAIAQVLAMSAKKLALDEAESNLAALQYSRNGPMNRMRFYLRQTGEDLSAVPGAAAEFQELNEKLQTPIDVGGLKFIRSEKEEMDLNAAAAAVSTAVSALELLAGGFSAGPSIGVHATPLGCGAVVNWGLPNLGNSVSMVARALSIGSNQLSYFATLAGRKASAIRLLNERLQAANAAGYEISTIDKQITASKIRIAMASHDMELQQKQIDQLREAESFLREKYTSAQLYAWVYGQTKALYYSLYTQAYDLAKKVEKVLKFERPQLASASFIQPGYWNASRDGLLAGDGLYVALKQLEAAYAADRGYDYEITKHVSLRQLDPVQLLYLRDTGACEFAIPEIYFDADYPGHYLRRLRSAALTIPCVVGPYASVSATLWLLSHRYRTSTSLQPTYAESVSPAGDGADARFASTHVPITAIAASTAVSDAGVFELSFLGDRYLPFEGAGAISRWRLELPPPGPLRPFDYGSISDVILTLRYTSVDGGEALRAAARAAVAEFAAGIEATSEGGGLFALFDIRHEFATAWAGLVAGAGGTGTGELGDLVGRLPVFAAGRCVVAREIYLLCDGVLPGSTVTVEASGGGGGSGSIQAAVLSKVDRSGFQGMSFTAYVDKAVQIPMTTWTVKLERAEGVELERVWMLVRYTLK